MRWTKFGLAALVGGTVLSATLAANAASSISNSLKGFSGDSTQAGTQGALASAGFSVFDSAGTPAAVSYDAGGAHFGSLSAGDSGRNYMRTIDSDYATSAFTAEITFTAATNDQAVFIGLGAGDTALFGTPDWSTQFSSASFWPEINNSKFVRFRTANDVNAFGDTGVPSLATGTHRFRMTFNPANNQLLGEIDTNYAGGPFVADAMTTNFPLVLNDQFSADGWPSEPSRIFFGGDDGVVFSDLSVQVVPEPATAVLLILGAGMMGRRLARLER